MPSGWVGSASDRGKRLVGLGARERSAVDPGEVEGVEGLTGIRLDVGAADAYTAVSNRTADVVQQPAAVRAAHVHDGR